VSKRHYNRKTLAPRKSARTGSREMRSTDCRDFCRESGRFSVSQDYSGLPVNFPVSARNYTYLHQNNGYRTKWLTQGL